MKLKSKKRNKGLTFVVIFTIFALALVQLTISHHLASDGQRVKELEQLVTQIEDENQRLEEDISSIGSLSAVSKKAEALGLIKTQAVLNVSPQVPVALGNLGMLPNTP